MKKSIFRATDFDLTIADQLVTYGRRLTGRGYVANTLGNIAVRVPHHCDPALGVTYTKHLGVSLEEMSRDNVVVTDIPHGNLLYGAKYPSLGHQMSRAIFRLRPDVHAVVHVHPDAAIAYFSTTGARALRYISADTALVLAGPARVLGPNINVEQDVSQLDAIVAGTNCIIMPNHGVTTYGRDLSEAYHRLTSVVAEVQRIILAMQIAALTGHEINWISAEEEARMYAVAESIVYQGGGFSPAKGQESRLPEIPNDN